MFDNENNAAVEAAAKAMKNYQTLRDANRVRQREWDPGNHARDLFWRANELAGETGELCNVLKKLHRERCGVPGSRATKDDLADEAADVIICVDLLALDAGISADELNRVSVPHTDSSSSMVQNGTNLAVIPGRALGALYLDDPEERRKDMTLYLAWLQSEVLWITKAEGVDLLVAVANKFNATTHKMGLTTFLRYEG